MAIWGLRKCSPSTILLGRFEWYMERQTCSGSKALRCFLADCLNIVSRVDFLIKATLTLKCADGRHTSSKKMAG